MRPDVRSRWCSTDADTLPSLDDSGTNRADLVGADDETRKDRNADGFKIVAAMTLVL